MATDIVLVTLLSRPAGTAVETTALPNCVLHSVKLPLQNGGPHCLDIAVVPSQISHIASVTVDVKQHITSVTGVSRFGLAVGR